MATSSIYTQDYLTVEESYTLSSHAAVACVGILSYCSYVMTVIMALAVISGKVLCGVGYKGRSGTVRRVSLECIHVTPFVLLRSKGTNVFVLIRSKYYF